PGILLGTFPHPFDHAGFLRDVQKLYRSSPSKARARTSRNTPGAGTRSVGRVAVLVATWRKFVEEREICYTAGLTARKGLVGGGVGNRPFGRRGPSQSACSEPIHREICGPYRGGCGRSGRAPGGLVSGVSLRADRRRVNGRAESRQALDRSADRGPPKPRGLRIQGVHHP